MKVMLIEILSNNHVIERDHISEFLNSDIRSKVFGYEYNFISLRATDFFDTPIYSLNSPIVTRSFANSISSPVYSSPEDFGEITDQLQIQFGSIAVSYTDPMSTISNLNSFIDGYLNMYDSTVPNVAGNSWSDRLFHSGSANPIDMYNNFKRDTSFLPDYILNIFKYLVNLNLYTEAGRLKFVKYMNNIHFS
jgi:hypothetical protein